MWDRPKCRDDRLMGDIPKGKCKKHGRDPPEADRPSSPYSSNPLPARLRRVIRG